jgi:hypothetical protein
VHVPAWQPEGPQDVWVDEPERSGMLGGVARVPELAVPR